jgi:UDP:flavonoid glycosyltransferase YjiC (YdhE family)
MRVLFCSVSAHGHVLPLAPLMEAALAEGHEVALVASADFADVVRAELPAGVRHLPVGPMPFVLASEAARRTGEDVMQPSVAGIGETFGGIMLELAGADAVAAARAWGADRVVSEVYCTLGAFVATVLDLPWYELRMTTPMPADWRAAIARSSAPHYAAQAREPVPAAGVLDLLPPAMRGGADEPGVLAVRTRAHRRAERVGVPECGERPRVLVTLGTIFSEGDLLDAVVDAVAENDVDVVATLGLSLQDAARDQAGPARGRVVHVPFTPLDELLDGVDLVVGVGGAGTTLAALSRGVPLVLWPQGADQPAIAARAEAAGAALTVGTLDELAAAVARALTDPSLTKGAAAVAESIAEAATPREAIRTIAG